MNFDKFFENMQRLDVDVELDGREKQSVSLLNNEALFQLPLISLIVLLLAKDRVKPSVPEIGQIVGECIENSMPGFKGSAQHVGWSANLRVRTVKALGFLEVTDLVRVDNRKGKIKITDLGKRVVESAMKAEDELAYSLAAISKSYRDICVSKKISSEVG